MQKLGKHLKVAKNCDHFLYIDELKLYVKDNSKVSYLVDMVYTFCSDIWKTFGLIKCSVIDLKISKNVMYGRANDREPIEETGYKYVGDSENRYIDGETHDKNIGGGILAEIVTDLQVENKWTE